MPFAGTISGRLASDVFLDDKPAATEGSTARNQPAHAPIGGSFQSPPSNEAKVQKGSGTVFIENKPAARMGGPAMTCNDPADLPAALDRLHTARPEPAEPVLVAS